MNDENVNEKTTTKSRRWKQLVLVFAVIVFGIFVLSFLVFMKKDVKKKVSKPLPLLVDAVCVNISDINMVVSGYGTVKPKMEIEIVPQVSGNVVYIHPQFKVGGFIRKGEEVFQIDPQDYELALQQARAGVAEAKVKLDMEQAEAEVARREWQALHPNEEPTSKLVFREPQVQQAEAAVASAKARLAAAELDLERTSVRLPVDVGILSERVDLGQYVSVGGSVGKAYGTGAFEIEVPLENHELAWFDFPNKSNGSNGVSPSQMSDAVVWADFAGELQQWKGKVIRSTGQVNERTRMVSAVIEIVDPLNEEKHGAPLWPGTFVEVEIYGKTLKNAFAVSRDALREGSNVWVVNDGILHIQPIETARRDRDYIYVTKGLADKDHVVLSTIDGVVEGMQVRVECDGVLLSDANDSSIAENQDTETSQEQQQ